VQLPFMSLSFYQGPIAERIGADFAWIPGLIIPALLYVMVERVWGKSPQPAVHHR
jgi:nucleobase:cation symporter-1, NCS1 family